MDVQLFVVLARMAEQRMEDFNTQVLANIPPAEKRERLLAIFFGCGGCRGEAPPDNDSDDDDDDDHDIDDAEKAKKPQKPCKTI